MTEDIVILPVTTRFAPSPTGRLHLGHGYSALLAHDAARDAGGRFLLRIENIDEGRCREAFVKGIVEDLQWLGLGWDGDILFQSRRGSAYAAALEQLKAMGLAYVCTCTRAEVAARAPHGPAGPLYPGTCRARARTTDPGTPHCWRLDMAKAIALAGPLDWLDGDAGRVVARPDLQGDVVIARKDAAASYHLAAVLDDAAQGVNLIVRGQDLFDATHIHRLLQALLGVPVPAWHHHRLVTGSDGARLAKRKGSPTLADMRRDGMNGNALAEMLRAGRFPVGFALGEA